MQLDSSSLKSGKNQKGLQYAVEKLSDMDEIGIVEFGLEDVVRNDLIPSILKRWLPEVYGDLDEEEISKKSKQERLENKKIRYLRNLQILIYVVKCRWKYGTDRRLLINIIINNWILFGYNWHLCY